MEPAVMLQSTDAGQVALDLIRKLELRNIQLDAVLQLTQAINFNFSNNALIEIYRYLLTEELRFKRFLLYLPEPEWRKYGSRLLDTREFPESPDKLLPYKHMGTLSNELKTIFPGFERVVPILYQQDPIAFVLLSECELDDIDIRKEVLSYVQGVTNIVAVANENRKLEKHRLQQEKIQNELSLAAQMQGMLIPDSLPYDGEVEMSAVYLPHRDVGGDYYDAMTLPDGEEVFCVADVSGKGIPAALLMSNFQANLRALIRFHPNLRSLVAELNRSVLSITKGEKFITLFIAKLERETGQLKYISAGHVPPLLFRDGEVHELKLGTTILGMFDQLPFLNVGKMQLQAGDVITAFTDGVSEATNYRGYAFGTEGVVEAVKHWQGTNLAELNKNIVTALRKHKGEAEFEDDISLLSVRFKP